MRSSLAAFALALALVAAPPAAGAKVYLSRAEALETAFPEADRVETENVVLDQAQADAIQALAKAPLDSKLVTVYRGMRGDECVGYAFIDIHTVRTLPEAFLVVLTPEGEVRTLRVLAFYEPPEYLPPSRWLEQFDRRGLDAELRVGGGIHGIAGSTLSARAVTGGVRRSLALFEVLVRGARPPQPAGSDVAGEPTGSPAPSGSGR